MVDYYPTPICPSTCCIGNMIPTFVAYYISETDSRIVFMCKSCGSFALWPGIDHIDFSKTNEYTEDKSSNE